MSVISAVLRETIRALLRDYKTQGKAAAKAGILHTFLQALQGVRRLYLIGLISLIGAILFSLSLFEWLQNAIENEQTYLFFNWRLIFSDFFFWLALVSLAVVLLALRQKSWLGAFDINQKLTELYKDSSLSRQSGALSVEDLAEKQRQVNKEELMQKSTSKETEHLY